MRASLDPAAAALAQAKAALNALPALAPVLRPAAVLASVYGGPQGRADYIGEAVSQAEHAAQAGHFAALAGADDDTVLASLLHDIGHLLPNHAQMSDGLGTAQHERIGAAFLHGLGFSDKTCELVEKHVQAKRYLCWKNPDYYAKLSDASKGTLKQQGGPMTTSEATAFERNPLFKAVIAMRQWDEMAKVVGLRARTVEQYADKITSAIRRTQARRDYERDGYVLLKDALTPQLKVDLQRWVNEIQNWTPTKGKWQVYYEEVDGKEVLCRTENFLPYHDGVRSLLEQGEVPDIVEAILGERGTLFKEKINYKLPGGGGFPAHQDAPAFTSFGQKNHLTVNIAIDAATPANGCLEVTPGKHTVGLFEQNPAHGGLSDKAEAGLEWIPVPLEAGDVLIFSSWLPHRSGSNTTNKPRRALYVTYNAASDGSFREAYYVDKAKVFPQKIERELGKDYSEGAKIYNVATPIKS